MSGLAVTPGFINVLSWATESLIEDGRGCIEPGCYADIAVFDPVAITDHATFKDPLRYATGMVHVFVNGVQVLADGEHTGSRPGRVVRGPGYGVAPRNGS